jgi:hypothetical protein
MPRPRPSARQPDLLAPEGPRTPMAAGERAELLALVGALLTEALAVGAAAAEAGDEDRA